MKAYYNEFDPKAAAWLRELIKRGLIADGIVDERSITEVKADDLVGFAQCHFFAGVGGWSYALRLAGIPDEYPVWTGSCPCQPFSVAGANKGMSDERHLWPAFFDLIKQSRPVTVFGEQVEGAVKHGWLDDLQADLEGEGYAVGAAVLGAHSVGSFHKRQRLYWVADHSNSGCESLQNQRPAKLFNSTNGKTEQESDTCAIRTELGFQLPGSVVAFSDISGLEKQLGIRGISRQANDGNQRKDIAGSCSMGITNGNGCEARREAAEAARHWHSADSAGWANPDWIACRDNKIRPIKSGIEPLVDGLPRGVVYGGDISEQINADKTAEARVMRLLGYGNAIVPQVAVLFIESFFEVIHAN